MSDAICGGVVTPLSLKMAQWYIWKGLFSMMAFSRAHHWQIASEVLIWVQICPGLWQLYWYQQVRVWCFDGPFRRMWSCLPHWNGLDTGHWVPCKPHMLLRLDGTLQWIQCLWNIRVISSIFNAFDYKLWYSFWKIFYLGRVLHRLVLKGNILLVIVRIFHFGRVFGSWKTVFCYFTLGGCWDPVSKILWYYGNIVAPWLEIGPVPPQWCSLTCQDVVVSPSVCGLNNCAKLPFILPWKEIDFFTIHQCLLVLCPSCLVMALTVLGLQCN